MIKTSSDKFLLLGILALGFLLRIIGVNFGLPHLYHADEPVIVNHALAYGLGDLNPHFFNIPPLISYLLFGCYGVFFVVGKAFGLFPDLIDFEYLFYSNPTIFYLIGRVIFGVFLGTMTVYVFYRLVDKHFGQKRALLGAFFLSICFLHVRDSHYLYVDIPLLLIIVVAFHYFLKLIEQGDSLRLHMISGACIGLAAATKYNGLFLVIPYLFATFVSVQHRRSILVKWLCSGIITILVFSALNPYAFIDFHFFIQEIQEEAMAHAGGVPWLHHLVYSLAGAMGIPMLAAACLGIVTTIFSWKNLERPEGLIGRKKVCMLVFILGYYLILVYKGQHYDRYVLPLVPFLLFFAADFLSFVCEKFYAYRKLILILGVLLLACPSLVSSVLFDKIMLAPDTRTQAKNWIEKNIPDGSSIALDSPFHMPRLNFSLKQLEEKRKGLDKESPHGDGRKRKLDYLIQTKAKSQPAYNLFFLVEDPSKGSPFLFSTPVLPYNVNQLNRKGVDYVILFSSPQNPGSRNFYEAIEKEGKLLARWTPFNDSEKESSYDSQPLTGGPFLWQDLLSRRRNGEVIKIYKI